MLSLSRASDSRGNVALLPATRAIHSVPWRSSPAAWASMPSGALPMASRSAVELSARCPSSNGRDAGSPTSPPSTQSVGEAALRSSSPATFLCQGRSVLMVWNGWKRPAISPAETSSGSSLPLLVLASPVAAPVMVPPAATPAAASESPVAPAPARPTGTGRPDTNPGAPAAAAGSRTASAHPLLRLRERSRWLWGRAVTPKPSDGQPLALALMLAAAVSAPVAFSLTFAD